MKVLTKITDTISKVAEWIIMAMILGLVGLIVTELCRRNFLNQSWLPTTELCGILFLWMAFIGIIPLYNKSGLIRLDFLVTRLHRGKSGRKIAKSGRISYTCTCKSREGGLPA